MKYKDSDIVIEYKGKLYKDYSHLLDDITDYGSTLEDWDGEYLYAMERWIITHVLKLEVTERKVK